MLAEEVARQLSFLCSLLVGFCDVASIGLLALQDKRRFVFWVIGVMFLAPALLLTSTSTAVVYFMVSPDMPFVKEGGTTSQTW